MLINVNPGLVPHHFSGSVFRPSTTGLSVQNQRLLLIGDHAGECNEGLQLVTSPSEIEQLYPDSDSEIAEMLRASFDANPSAERYGIGCRGSELAQDLGEVIEHLPEMQFTQIAVSTSDPADLVRANEFLEARGDNIRQLDGQLFSAVSGSAASIVERYCDLKTLANITLMAMSDSRTRPHVWAATLASINARFADKPYLPYQSLGLPKLASPLTPFTLSQRDLLLKAGISTHTVEGRSVKVDRLVTMHSKDESMRDLNKKQILSFLRHDFVEFLKKTFPRHALSNDETQASGEVATPKSARDLVIARHLRWKKNNFVQDDGDQFKNLIKVWIDEKSPETLCFYLPVQLMGQLRRTVTTIAFTP